MLLLINLCYIFAIQMCLNMLIIAPTSSSQQMQVSMLSYVFCKKGHIVNLKGSKLKKEHYKQQNEQKL